MIYEWLDTLSILINENIWLAPLICVLAGMLTSLTPCSLSTIPLIISYVGGTSAGAKKSFRLSLAFAIGNSITFIVLGVIAALLGKLIGNTGKWWYIVLGVIMILMALQLLEIYQFIPSTYLTEKNTKKGYLGAIIAGVLAGLFSSPCATPVLVVLLAFVAGAASLFWGVFLLVMYSIGYSIVVISIGTFIGSIRKVIQTKQYGRFSEILKYVFGISIILVGLYMFYLGF